MCRFELAAEFQWTPQTRAVAGGVHWTVSSGHLAGHRKASSGAGFAVGVRVSTRKRRLSHACARAHANLFTHVSSGHPDTSSIGAGLRCPLESKYVDTQWTPSVSGGHREPSVSMSNKPMRAAMPEITAFVDAFRAAGLTDNDAIKRGMQEGGFHARENGNEVGKRAEWGQGVTPVLSYEAEQRLADLWWQREQGGE